MKTPRQIVFAVIVILSALGHNAPCEEPVRTVATANTSTSGSFGGLANGNLGGSTSVSNVGIRALLYPGQISVSARGALRNVARYPSRLRYRGRRSLAGVKFLSAPR